MRFSAETSLEYTHLVENLTSAASSVNIYLAQMLVVDISPANTETHIDRSSINNINCVGANFSRVSSICLPPINCRTSRVWSAEICYS